MKQEIIQFCQTNPWSALLTGCVVLTALTYFARGLLSFHEWVGSPNKLLAIGIRLTLIVVVTCGFFFYIHKFFGIPALTRFVDNDQNTLIYWIVLFCLESFLGLLWYYKNPLKKPKKKKKKLTSE